MKTNLPMIALLVLATAASAFARGAGAEPAKPATGVSTNSPLKEPVKAVLDHYLKIQSVLAEDATNGVVTNANAIAKLVKDDKAKTLPPDIAKQAEAVAKAGDIGAVREAFKPLSESLINYLADKKVKSNTYDEIFCPMQEASWLQTSEEVQNPYLGHSMPGCGIVKRTF